MKPVTAIPLVCVLAAVWGLGGCSGPEPSADAEARTESHAHAHAAPHGGTLVELGEHAASLELVFDARSGVLDLFVLDAHAENYVRLSMDAVPVLISVDSPDPVPAELRAMANTLTGETVGDTSRFSATLPLLIGQADADVVIPVIEIGGTSYTNVSAHVHPVAE